MADPLGFVRPSRPPTYDIPASSATVDVRVIDTNTRLYVSSGLSWEPVLRGHDGTNVPVYCFLVSHENRHLLFDLGVRTDWESLPPKVVQFVKASTQVTGCDRDIASVLDDSADSDNGPRIRSSDIEAIVWSHSHFDHIGDPSRFPPTTELVVGPGVKAASWPGYSTDPDGSVLDSDAAGRPVREVNFAAAPLRVGGFDALDYFGDGSFYLLDAPGHARGHMCGLARTTADPPSFVLMGADACHHAGVLRPSRHLPLPHPIFLGTPGENAPLRGCGGCPGELLKRLGEWKDLHEPFFQVTRGPVFPDYEAAVDTIKKIQELDAAGNVLVVLAHDASLSGHLPLFPKRVNDWQSRGLRETTRWSFCKELEHVEP